MWKRAAVAAVLGIVISCPTANGDESSARIVISTAENRVMAVSGFFGGHSRLAGGLSANASSLVAAEKEIDLSYGDTAQNGSEYREEQRIERYGVSYRPLPKGFGYLIVAAYILGLAIAGVAYLIMWVLAGRED